MIDLYFWPTPNGRKVTVMLEECGLRYEVIPVDITRGDQFDPQFLALNPNHRIPVIVDRDAGGGPMAIFESGAILLYLAEKSGRLLPADRRTRYETLQWLFWQVGGLGPMAGQCHHFRHYAPEPVPYAAQRYCNEVNRLYGVMNRRLADRAYLAGEYSIADIAAWPWVRSWKRQGQRLADFPHLEGWLGRVGDRPAVQRGARIGKGWRSLDPTSEEARRMLFDQTAASSEREASRRASVSLRGE